MKYNNYISFRPHGMDYQIIRDLKVIGDVWRSSSKWIVELPILKIEGKSFPTLGHAKSFVFSTLNKKA